MIADFLISEATYVLIYIIIVASLNLSIGFTGLINLGHMVFFGVGAYASAILTINGVPWYISILLAAILASILGTLMSAITARLKRDYLAIVTLGLVFMAIAISRNWISLTRGALGLPGIPAITSNPFHYMLLVFLIALLSVLFFYWLANSEAGRIFQAIRDDETAASVLGKNTYLYKILSIAIAAFFAGIAGSLFAHFIKFIDPTIFDLEFFMIVLAMLISGGLASIKGSILGVLVLNIIITAMRFLVVTPQLIGPVREMAFAVALIVILIFRPRGLFGKVDV